MRLKILRHANGNAYIAHLQHTNATVVPVVVGERKAMAMDRRRSRSAMHLLGKVHPASSGVPVASGRAAFLLLRPPHRRRGRRDSVRRKSSEKSHVSVFEGKRVCFILPLLRPVFIPSTSTSSSLSHLHKCTLLLPSSSSHLTSHTVFPAEAAVPSMQSAKAVHTESKGKREGHIS